MGLTTIQENPTIQVNNGNYHTINRIPEMEVFTQHNLVKYLPFTNIALVMVQYGTRSCDVKGVRQMS